MPYTIPARTNKNGKTVPEIIIDDEFKDVVEGLFVYLSEKGYPQAKVGGKSTKLHRLLWTIKYGSCPKMLDHVHGNKLDCRLESLRPANSSLNGRNVQKRYKNGRQDLPVGVVFRDSFLAKGKRYPAPKPYAAQFQCHGKMKHLGLLATPEEAGAVYQAMKFMLILVESALCA